MSYLILGGAREQVEALRGVWIANSGIVWLNLNLI